MAENAKFWHREREVCPFQFKNSDLRFMIYFVDFAGCFPSECPPERNGQGLWPGRLCALCGEIFFTP